MKLNPAKLALTAALMVSCVGMADTWTDPETCIQWTYVVSDGRAEIFKRDWWPAITKSTAGALIIPSSLGGYPVTKIGQHAFYNCSSLTSVAIPDSVTSIGIGAFYGCSGLTYVTISASVTNISNEAFSYCNNLEAFIVANENPIYRSSLGLLLTKDGKTLVSGINGDVTIPDCVTSIGVGAFRHRNGLTSVTIPNSVTKIMSSAFWDCNGLMSISVDAENPNYSAINGLLLTKDEKTLLQGVNGDAAIPDSVTSIGSYAFSGCSGLTSVTIPDSVTNIGVSAFWDCSSLTNVTIPNGVTSIGNTAFYNCIGLTSVTIPDRVTRIGSSVFHGCRGLTSVTIPDGVTSIGNFAFYGCSGLTSVSIPDSVKSVGDCVFQDCTNLVSVVFTGDAPSTVEGSSFKNVNQSCVVKVPFGSTGWDVDVPSVWQGMEIDYTIPAIKFNANGGVIHATEQITDNGLVGELPDPSRDGYLFVGWFTTTDGGERILPGMVIDKSVRAYAHWSANRYVVELNPNGGSLEPSDSTVEVVFDSEYGELPCPIRIGYGFVGWTTSLIDGTVIDEDTLATTNQVLYALWEANRYQIVYDANDGSGETYCANATFDEDTEIVVNPFTWMGHVFVGWATSAEGEVVYEPGQSVRNLTAEADGEVALYAVWEPLVVATPVISPGDGSSFVGETCSVTISCATDGADIYFSTRGTPPRIRDANRYTGVFIISDTTQIMAVALKENVTSEVVVVTISRRELTLPEATEAAELSFDTGGNANWLPIVDATAVGGFSARSGIIGCASYGSSNVTWLATEVVGAGTFSFRWKVDCEHDYTGMCLWDHLAVFTNGVEAARIDGSQNWADVSFAFTDDGNHSVCWMFVKDDEDDEGVVFDDCGWVSGVSWIPVVVTSDKEYGIGEIPGSVKVRPGVTLRVQTDHEPSGSEISDLTSRVVVVPKTAEQKAEYFKVVGSYDATIGSVVLKAVFDEDAIGLSETVQEVLQTVIDSAFVGGEVILTDVKSGLYYGIVVVDELSKMESASSEVTFVKAGVDGVRISIPKPEGSSAFFKIVVRDDDEQ